MTYAVEIEREFSNPVDFLQFEEDLLAWLFEYDLVNSDDFDYMTLPTIGAFHFNCQFRFERLHHAMLAKLTWGGV